VDDEVGGLAGRAEDALTLAGLVAGASIVVFFTLVIFHGFEPDQWHLAVQFGRVLVINNSVFSVVACTVHEEAMHVHTVLGGLFDIFDRFGFNDLERELQLVNRDLVEARVSLEATSEEALREE